VSSFGANELRADSAILTGALTAGAVIQTNPAGGQNTTPRGMAAQLILTTSTAAIADLAVTDLVLNNLPTIAGHTYEFRVHTPSQVSAVISRWILTLNVNGVVFDRLCDWRNRSAVVHDQMLEGTCTWIAPATQATDDFAVGIDEVTATAATCTLTGAATARRRFEVVDLGAM
jgi:hypothetical protein